MWKHRAAKLIHHPGDRGAEIAINTQTELGPIHDDSLRKQGVVVDHAAQIRARRRIYRNLEALQQQQALVQTRIDYSQGLITGGLNSWETTSLTLTQAAIGGETAAVQIEYLGNVLGLIPDFDIGAE